MRSRYYALSRAAPFGAGVSLDSYTIDPNVPT